MEIIDYIKPSKIERDKIIIKDEETIKKYNELIPNFKMCVKCESLGTVDKYYTDRNGKITKNCLVCRDNKKNQITKETMNMLKNQQEKMHKNKKEKNRKNNTDKIIKNNTLNII